MRLTRIGKQPVEVGKTVIKVKHLPVDIPTDEWYSLIDAEGAIVGAIHLRITLSASTRHPTVKNVGKSWVAFKSFNRFAEESPVPPSLRSRFTVCDKPEAEPLQLTSSLFIGLALIEINDIIEDAKMYMAEASIPTCAPNSIPFSGRVSMTYPDNLTSLPNNIWMFCFPCGMRLSSIRENPKTHPFVITDAEGVSKFVMFLVTYEALDKETTTTLCNTVQSPYTDLYIPRALAVVAKTPIFDVMERWLWGLYDRSFASGGEKDAFCNAVADFTMRDQPVTYGSTQTIDIFNHPFRLTYPTQGDIPYSPFILGELLTYFDKTTVIQIVNYLLLEERIIFCSKDMARLVRTIENFKTILFPLEWVGVCVPILPRALLEYITSPFPYILGLPSDYRAEAAEILKEEEVILVDIDTNVIYNSLRHPVPDIPTPVANTLLEELTQVSIVDFDDTTTSPWEPPIPSDTPIQLCFFKAITSLLAGYERHLGFTWFSDSVLTHFLDDAFLLSKPAEMTGFLRSLTETQSFKYFCEREAVRAHSATQEWVQKRMYTQPLSALLKYYTATTRQPIIPPIVSNPFTLGSLKKEDFPPYQLIHTEPPPVQYTNKFDSLKVTVNDTSAVHNEGTVFVDKLLRANNEGGSAPDPKPIFHDMVNDRTRYTFLSYLLLQTCNFTLKGYTSGTVSNETKYVLLEVFNNLLSVATSQNDTMSPVLILNITTHLYSIINFVQEPLCVQLSKQPAWSDQRVWQYYFCMSINQSKYTLLKVPMGQLRPTIASMSVNERLSYNENECNKTVAVVHELVRTMKQVGLNNQLICTIVNRIVGILPLKQENKNNINSIIRVITRSSSESSGVSESQELYNAIYC